MANLQLTFPMVADITEEEPDVRRILRLLAEVCFEHYLINCTAEQAEIETADEVMEEQAVG